jgi:AsmA protein
MKKLAVGVLALVVLIIIGISALVVLVDTNDIKRLVQSKVYALTERELLIEGELSWRFFPSIGFTLGRTVLKHHPLDGQGNTLVVEGVDVSVAVLPLFSHQLELGEIVLLGAEFRMTRYADGHSSLDDLMALGEPATVPGSPTPQVTTPKVTMPSSESRSEPWQISVKGLHINHATIHLVDNIADSLQQIGPINFTLDGLEFDTPNPFQLSFSYDDGQVHFTQQSQGKLMVSSGFRFINVVDLQSKLRIKGESLPNKEMQLDVDLGVTFNRLSQQIAIRPLELRLNQQLNVTGEISATFSGKPDVRLNLYSPKVESAWFLDSSAEQDRPSALGPVGTEVAATPREPDLTALSLVNVAGQFKVDAIEHGDLKADHFQAKFTLKDGIVQLIQLTAGLYDGVINAHGTLNSTAPMAQYQIDASVNHVQARALLTDAVQLDLLSGTLDLDTSLSGNGFTPTSLLGGLKGKLTTKVSDGSINGVNIPLMLRQARAKLKGKSEDSVEAKKTDFSALTMQGTFGQSVFRVDRAELVSPLLRVDGQGETHLLDQTLDFEFITRVVASLSGQGAEEDLKGLPIPLKVSGSWRQPKYKLELKKLVESQAKKDSTSQLKESLEGKLKGLFK